ncbi:site-specific integrase (plasmid) [Chromobacterium amazonense]|uniref:site-specific integrase n=1 Tax=Chromobacterium amazonense TaxID=1382803 RepID=UPI00237D3300|nr:site-specific integrase [Chromobacterium amazonense]MDE1714388.1 site-specific integrase [Chromobacterium amazonense]
MAQIVKRGEMQWRARVRKKGYPEQSRTFSTKADAEKWARIVESEIERGVFVNRSLAESTTLEEALDRYQSEVSSYKKGAEPERYIIGMWKGLKLAKSSMASIRSVDLAKLRDEWLKTHAPATVVRRLAVLSHVFTVARKDWGMESIANPVELVRKPVIRNARTRRIESAVHEPSKEQEEDRTRGATDDEVKRVVASSGSRLLPTIIVLAVETAARRGELVKLTWKDLDLKRRVMHLGDTKNGDDRDVPLSSTAIQALQTLPRSISGKVFGIRPDAVTRAFSRAVERARQAYVHECKDTGRNPSDTFLVDLRFHDLRHEATSHLASIFPLHELAKITGHKDPRMLMRYYHPKAEDLAKKLA